MTSRAALCCVGVTGTLACAWMGAHALAQSGNAETPALSAALEREVARVVAEIDRIEAETLTRLADGPGNPAERTLLLGKLLMYDKELSVARNEACAFCHMPEAGFTGPISELNATTVAYPGSIRTRY